MIQRLRDLASGALLLPALLCVAIGASAHQWGLVGFAGTLGRMFDSLAPHMLGTGLALAGATALLGRGGWIKGAALALCLAALAAGGALVARHVAVAAPLSPQDPAGLTVLWFNMLADNTTPPDVLADALIASGADVVVLGEAGPIRPALPRLRETYPHQLGCISGICSTTILSRIAFEADSPGMIETSRRARMGVVRLTPPGGSPLDVIAVHLTKPWFHGFFDVDLWHLMDQVARSDAAHVVLGDFNAAPWSRPMQRIFAETGLAPPRHSPATWPTEAGAFGVPIDHILTGGGARLTSLAPWGETLGSNHRGLLGTLTWPTPGP